MRKDGKRAKKKTLAVPFFLVAFIFLINSVLAAGDWVGTVRIGGLIAPAGTTVSAYRNGDLDASTSVVSSPAGYYLIHVAGNVTNPATTGDNVTFKIAGVNANEGVQRFTHENHPLDLSTSQLADSTPPTRSGGLPTGTITTTSTTLRVTTDESATCKYGTIANTAYSSIVNTFTTTGGKSHSKSLTSLSNAVYTYYVRCIDTSGNNNTDDYTINFTINVAASDTTPPYRTNPQPTNHSILRYDRTSVGVNITTDESAKCRYNLTSGVDYANMTAANTTSLGTLHTWNFTGLTSGTGYNIYIRCNDTAGNNNTDDYYITFSTSTLYNRTLNITANVTTSVDAKNTTNTTLDVVTNTTVNDTVVNITTNSETFTNESLTTDELKYVKVEASDNLNTTVLTFLMIKVYYTDEELAVAGIIDENMLAIYWYNETSNEWIRLSTSLSWVSGTGVDTVNNYVWANITHFSYFALGGLKGNGVACSANADCYSGYCRSDYDGGSFCAQSSTHCVHGNTLALQYASGYATCYGNYKEECSSGSWSGTYCAYGCSSGVCGSAPVTTTTVPTGGGGFALVTESKTVSTITPTTPATIAVTKSDTLKIEEIKVEVKTTVSNVKITVKESLKPYAVPVPISADVGNVYKYVEVTKEDITDADISKVKIKFKVEKSWISNNNIDETNVYLNRWAEDKWNMLKTVKLSEDGTYIYYEAESPGLSVFSIVGEKKGDFWAIIDLIDKYYTGEDVDFWSIISLIDAYYG